MLKRTKIALVAGAAVLAMAGVGGGIAFATDGGAPTPTPTPTANATPATPRAHHHARGLIRRVEHGEFTVHTKTGDQVVDVQRGQVTAVSATSVTIRSDDGFTATYTVGSTSKVRAQKKATTIANVHTGDKVYAAATRSGNTDTLRRLVDAS